MAINMQSSYIYALLLIFLLLVDKPHTVTARSGLSKVVTDFLKPLGRTNQVKKGRKNQSPSPSRLPPQPPSPPSQPHPQLGKIIPYLSIVKEYLSEFGYLQDSGPGGTFSNVSDQDTISAIETYQRYFNLQVTGGPTKETIQQMWLPRCGVPDMNFEYELTIINNVSWPKGKPQWFPVGTKNLTYGFLPESDVPPDMIKVFRDAFTLWSQTTRLVNFTESLKYEDADIKIGFYNLSDILDGTLVGGTIIQLESDSGIKTAEMLLDGSKYWVLPTDNFEWSFEKNEFDLETVAMHQIGHLLGLEHSNNTDSVMYPAILPTQQRKVMITYSDNNTLHQLYTNSANSGRFAVPFGTSTSGLLTTFSLGFACMVVLLH